MGALLLLLSGCAVQIKDEQFCSPIFDPIDFSIIAVDCDNFLTANPQSLTAQQWLQQVVTNENNGLAAECTTSQALADMKNEVEKLCSKTKCDESTAAAAANLVRGLVRLQNKSRAALTQAGFPTPSPSPTPLPLP